MLKLKIPIIPQTIAPIMLSVRHIILNVFIKYLRYKIHYFSNSMDICCENIYGNYFHDFI
jgi:hypothetical protein